MLELVTSSCHSLFFLLACPFVSRVKAFIYDVRVRGVVSMFNETAHSFLCVVVRERLLPCRVVVTAKWVQCIVYTDCVYPAFAPLLADITRLHFLFRKWWCCFLALFSPSFSPCILSFFSIFFFGLLAISYPLVSLPD